MVKYLNTKGLLYESKFFNQNKKYKGKHVESTKYSRKVDSITLVAKSSTYPSGHYLLRVKEGWVDPWIEFPSIDNVKAGIRKKLPGDPWYVLYPAN